MFEPMTNPYLELTAAFNRGRRRALVSSGQAVVLHRLAVMSKDGDWVLREDDEALGHVLRVLADRGARYRFGAPLDVRWLSGGWSSHLEHWQHQLRLRTDFVTRPPRISAADLGRIWEDADAGGSDVVGLEPLAQMKLTRREKDYAVIGELARRMPDVAMQLRFSRSARDLASLAAQHPEAFAAAARHRPILTHVHEGRDAMEAALDQERRELIRAEEARLARYRGAAEPWAALWPDVARQIDGRPLREAHAVVVARAEHVLPFTPDDADAAEDRDEFLSEEDLDLANLTHEELIAYWNLWLAQAQATNDEDAGEYSHGVFERDPVVGERRG